MIDRNKSLDAFFLIFILLFLQIVFPHFAFALLTSLQTDQVLTESYV